MHGPWRHRYIKENASQDHRGRSEQLESNVWNHWHNCQGEVAQKQHHHLAVGPRTKSEQQESESVQEPCVAFIQSLRQDSDPRAEGQERHWNESRTGTDDHHVSVVALGVPTCHLTVRVHGAQAVWMHVALQRLYTGGAHRDVDSHEYRTDGPEQSRRKPSELSTPELDEMANAKSESTPCTACGPRKRMRRLRIGAVKLSIFLAGLSRATTQYTHQRSANARMMAHQQTHVGTTTRLRIHHTPKRDHHSPPKKRSSTKQKQTLDNES